MKLKNRELSNILQVLDAIGYTVTRTGGDHIKVTEPNGAHSVFTGSTPSDISAIRNFQSTLKREFGLDIRALLKDPKRIKQLMKQARK